MKPKAENNFAFTIKRIIKKIKLCTYKKKPKTINLSDGKSIKVSTDKIKNQEMGSTDDNLLNTEN